MVADPQMAISLLEVIIIIIIIILVYNRQSSLHSQHQLCNVNFHSIQKLVCFIVQKQKEK